MRVAVITISTLIRAPLIHPAKKSDQKTELTVFVPHLQTSDFTVVLLPKLASKPKTQSLGSRPAIQYRWAGKPEAAPSFKEQSYDLCADTKCDKLDLWLSSVYLPCGFDAGKAAGRGIESGRVHA